MNISITSYISYFYSRFPKKCNNKFINYYTVVGDVYENLLAGNACKNLDNISTNQIFSY